MTIHSLEPKTPPATKIDRREREGFFYGTTDPHWHDTLRRLFSHVDNVGVESCILHGYGGYDGVESGDIDCIVRNRDLPNRFGRALNDAVAAEGCRLINWYHRGQQGHVFIIARESESGFDFFWLDVCDSDYEGPWRYYSGEEMLSRKRRDNGFWATAPGIEFACYVTIKVTKHLLTEAHGNRLSRLYALNPDEARRELARFYGTASRDLICAAAESNDWGSVRERFDELDQELRGYGRRRALRQPWVAGAYLAGEGIRRAQRLGVRTGVHLQLLGSDDAVHVMTSELSKLLASAFRSVRIVNGSDSREPAAGGLKQLLAERVFLSRTGLLISQNRRSFGLGTAPNLTIDLSTRDETQVIPVARRVIDLLERRTKGRLNLP